MTDAYLPALARLLVDAAEAVLTETEADEERKRYLRIRLEQAAWDVREHLYRAPS